MFNKHDITRNEYQLSGPLTTMGYDSWWHSFVGYDVETGARKSFFIEFFLVNPGLGGDKPVFGQRRVQGVKKRGHKSEWKTCKPSYLMVKAGVWGNDAAQVHKFYGLRKIELRAEAPFEISAGECYLSEDATRGYVSVTPDEASQNKEYLCQAGTMAWSLVFNKKIAFNAGYGSGPLFRKFQLFRTFWHAEGMKTEFKGDVIWNGRRYIVKPETSFGYADKTWGRDLPNPRIWLSSNKLKSEISGKKLKNSAFCIGGTCPEFGLPEHGKIGMKRKFLSAFWYEGRPFEFNFLKFLTFPKTEFSFKEGTGANVWMIRQKSLFSSMTAEISCRKKDMLLMNYESPEGKRNHRRLWYGGTGSGTICLYRFGRLVDRIHAEDVFCSYGEISPKSPSKQ